MHSEAMLQQLHFMTMMFMSMQGYNSNSEFALMPLSIPIQTISPLQNCAVMNTGMVSRKEVMRRVTANLKMMAEKFENY